MAQPFDVNMVGGATVVCFHEHALRSPGVEALAGPLFRLADRPRLRLGFARVEHLGAAALGVLLRLH